MRQTEKLYLDTTSTMPTFPKNPAAWRGVSPLADATSVRASISTRTFSQQQSLNSEIDRGVCGSRCCAADYICCRASRQKGIGKKADRLV